ncbi:5,6-dimethylbenzimidazole synthase [Phaeovulum vinaykumarii]|uniref:Cob(II)yrinic acid a,c-diamide reductase n=1 Tax=Phaeovulum vinaykumarii TaxID=407234 RepID=A0A1N7KCM6_9RHOB|nr:5,6-dimethylbenzimidazole synthase [Phaeovulum vinaykumarii]SIS59194.1 cob(II)yrinic acid a,c-diamide reductase [Phaeovulum vinaykumarii]SOB94038.1 cob(II)yrinic acid a,c-diamide reductase [Phaeovulum vinaykumarii]
MEFSPEQSATLLEILRWRRDVRHFHPDPIPEPVVERLRQAMEMAPSVGNARPWRVLRVKSPDLRARVGAEFERCRAAAGAGYTGAQASAYGELKLAGIDRAPEQLAVFTVKDPAEGAGLGRQTMPETLRQSTAMAVYTLWLAARAENLGLGMVSIVDPAEMERIFEVPEDWEFSAYLCLGRPEFEDDLPLLHRKGWQENIPTTWELR